MVTGTLSGPSYLTMTANTSVHGCNNKTAITFNNSDCFTKMLFIKIFLRVRLTFNYNQSTEDNVKVSQKFVT